VIKDAGHISFRYVRTGTATGDGYVPVLAGLDRQDRVATDPIKATIAYKAQHQTQVNIGK